MHPIQEYCLEHRLSYAELARMIGFKTRASITQHIKGWRRVSPESALKYHRILGIPLEELRPDLWPAPQEVPDVQETSPDN